MEPTAQPPIIRMILPSSQMKIYIDEDAMDSDLVAALLSRGIPVCTPFDAGLMEKSDEEQLTFSAEKASFFTRSTSPISIASTPSGLAPTENMRE